MAADTLLDNLVSGIDITRKANLLAKGYRSRLQLDLVRIVQEMSPRDVQRILAAALWTYNPDTAALAFESEPTVQAAYHALNLLMNEKD